MTLRLLSLSLATISSLVLFVGCSSDSTGPSEINQGSNSPTTGSGTGSGTGTSMDTTGTSGTSGAGTGGDMSSATTGTGGSGTGGDSTGSGGSSGSGNTEGGAPSSEGGVTPPSMLPHGKSAGCGMAAGADSATKFTLHEINIPDVGAAYLPGAKYADASGPYNFTHRPYSIKLPTNYDPNKAYAVSFGGGGCGGSATGFASNPGAGLTIVPNPNTEVIQVGLSYLTGCFNDGGPSIGNAKDTPEYPYFKAVLADVESKLCVDKARVFVVGYSSGGWEAFTLGCAAANLIRGIGTEEGGMRADRPQCTGPIAALMVAGTADTENPIGPLMPTDPAYKRLDSPGSGPGRDDILARNGCVGTDTKTWDPAFPACKQYTGCPPAYPVVWCALDGVGHNDSTYMGVNYSPGGMYKFLSALPEP
jgi:poly(3-hydroxybutyrate) depolymerase